MQALTLSCFASPAALVLVAVLGAGCRSHGTPASKYETVQVSKGPLVSKVTASGTVSALVTVTVGAQVSGRVIKLHADYNSVVKKGQLLAEIDPLLYQAALDSQAADVVSAKAQIASAIATRELNQANYERAKKLFALKLMDQADFDTAKANLDTATAAIDTARGNLLTQEAQVRQARANLYYTKIISPIDGVVISRSVDVGQTVVSSYQAPALFIIAQDLQKMQVDTSVAESDIGKLKSGVQASFTVDAYPGEKFVGTIRQIRDNPQTVQNVVTYDVVIDVSNPDFKLLPGMTASAEVVTDHRDDVLHVSNAAFRFHPPADFEGAPRQHQHGSGSPKSETGLTAVGEHEHAHEHHSPDRKMIWVLRDDHPVMVPIRIGISDGHETEIAEGQIEEGDKVITGLAADPGKQQTGMRRLF
jgi:HlyD family secretion protein